jgi:hypothetical protein
MKRLYCLLIVLGSLFTESCTEPYALQTENYESAIVIEATLTDEFKHQEIKLSRTYKLEEDGPDMETGAVVFVTDNIGNQYNFSENGDKYISQEAFKALPNVTYQLHIVTSDGKTYTSTNEALSSLTDIDDVTASVGINNNGEQGVQILTNSTKSTDGIEYYRFDYEETNKVIAPHWISRMGNVVYFPQPLPNGAPGKIEMVDWPYEAKICYSTEQSKEISISNTSLNSSNTNVSLVRFLKASDYKIANRYSIKVTMYNESLAAYNFYDALKKSSNGGSLLSQNQPGFFSGNIKNQSNQNEKVIGFFDVSHVSGKRIFFNFEDLFPNNQKPEYPYSCPVMTPLNEDKFKFYYCFCTGPGCPTNPSCQGFFILESVRIRMKAVYIYGDEFVHLTNIQCGDCTSFSSNVMPYFWVD